MLHEREADRKSFIWLCFNLKCRAQQESQDFKPQEVHVQPGTINIRDNLSFLAFPLANSLERNQQLGSPSAATACRRPKDSLFLLLSPHPTQFLCKMELLSFMFLPMNHLANPSHNPSATLVCVSVTVVGS